MFGFLQLATTQREPAPYGVEFRLELAQTDVASLEGGTRLLDCGQSFAEAALGELGEEPQIVGTQFVLEEGEQLEIEALLGAEGLP